MMKFSGIDFEVPKVCGKQYRNTVSICIFISWCFFVGELFKEKII